MTKEDLTFIAKQVTEALEKKELEKKHKTISEYFKEGLFKFIIPGLIVFIATFFSLQRAFEIFKIKTEGRFTLVEKDIEHNKKAIEKNEKSFEELAKEYHASPRGNKTKKDTNPGS